MRDQYPLIVVANLGPDVIRLLHQARRGATDAEVRHAVEAVEGQ